MTDPRTTGSARVAAEAPAPARRRRPAQGARYIVTGISASAVLGGITAFGIADLRAAQAEPTSPTVPPGADVVAPSADNATALPIANVAPPSTPAPIIKIVIRRSGGPSAAPSAGAVQPANAADSAAIGAAVPPATAAPATAAPATAAPIPPAQSRSKAS